jgi:hypothetical protein
MTIAMIVAMFFGMFLARYFRVMVIIPASAAALATAVALEILADKPLAYSFGIGAIALVGTQVGYIFGQFAQEFMRSTPLDIAAKSRAAHRRNDISPLRDRRDAEPRRMGRLHPKIR